MIHIFGGGTLNHVRAHCELSAYSKGTTAFQLQKLFKDAGRASTLHVTAFADPSSPLLTVESVHQRLLEVLANPATTAIIFSVAIADFEGQVGDIPSGHHAPRLKSRDGDLLMKLTPSKKLLPLIKQQRPDVFSVGFKTTADVSDAETLRLATRQIDETGMSLVLANDIVRRQNSLVWADGSSIEHRAAPTRQTALYWLVSLVLDGIKQ